jgi:hypothetical protein
MWRCFSPGTVGSFPRSHLLSGGLAFHRELRPHSWSLPPAVRRRPRPRLSETCSRLRLAVRWSFSHARTILMKTKRSGNRRPPTTRLERERYAYVNLERIHYKWYSYPMSPRWCSGQCACHWTQRSRVRTRPRRWILRAIKIHSTPSSRMGSKAGRCHVVRFYGV